MSNHGDGREMGAKVPLPILCPSNGKEIFPDAAMLVMTKPTRVACLGCNDTHVWDARKLQFLAD